MVRTFLKAVTMEIRGMHEAAYLLAGFALLSQILGLLRDRLLAGGFGIGETLDLYYAAFRIPDFLFATVASLFSLYAILPVLSRAGEMSGRVLEKILLWFFLLTGAAAVVAFVLAPYVVPKFLPGFSDEALAQVVLLSRILLLQPILLGASNVLASLTQLRSRFILYAISPLLYNLGIIVGITVFYPWWGLAGLGWGVVLGAFLHVLIQVPHFVSERGEVEHPAPFAPLREILTLSIPRTLTLSAGQFTLLALTALASLLTPGSIAAFTFSMNLQAVPLAVIGMSYSVAAFPTLARFMGEGKRELFIEHMVGALRHIVFWSILATVLIVVLRAQIVRVILGVGAFDWDATRITAAALAVLALSLGAQSITYLLARGYYAAGKTRRPLVISLVTVFVSITSAALLSVLFSTHTLFAAFIESLFRIEGVEGSEMLMLALGFALGSLVGVALGLYYFMRDFSVRLDAVFAAGMRSFAASVIGGFFAYLALTLMGSFVDIDTFVGIFAQGCAGGIVGLSAAASILFLLKSPELAEIIDASLRRFKDSKDITVEPAPLA